MKNIFLVRHAKAQEHREFDYDFNRPLIKKGLKDAKKMADKIKNRLSGKVLFISSNSTRAFETAHIFAVKLDYSPVKILLKDFIYHDPKPEQLLELIKEIDDSYDTVVLFGHNPSLSEFASFLIKDFEFDIPKCGVAAFAFDKNSWKEIEKQGGVLKFAEYPVRKSEKISAFENTLIIKITESILDSLENINPHAASNVLKSIAKYSARLAGSFTDNLKHNKADKKSSHKEDEKIEHKAGEKNKLEKDKKSEDKKSEDKKSDGKADKKHDYKAKENKKTDHKKDDKHEHKNDDEHEHKSDEKADTEVDNKPDIKVDEQSKIEIDEQANIKVDEKVDIKVDEKVESESIKKTDSKEKSGKKGGHKHHKKSDRNKTDEKTGRESDDLADWDTDDKDTDDKNSGETDTNSKSNSENNIKTDKKDDWGIDGPSTNQ